MASDLPEQGWSTSSEMARALASYIDCPHRILSILRENFASNKFPTVETILRYRQEHLNPKPQPEALRTRPDDAYYHHEVSMRLDERNRRFLMRLSIERALSARANGNALLEDAA